MVDVDKDRASPPKSLLVRVSDALVQTATDKLKRKQFENRNSISVEEPVMEEMPDEVALNEEAATGLMSREM